MHFVNIHSCQMGAALAQCQVCTRFILKLRNLSFCKPRAWLLHQDVDLLYMLHYDINIVDSCYSEVDNANPNGIMPRPTHSSFRKLCLK